VTAADNAPSTLPTPSCPASTGSFWPVDPGAALPTIAGLDFANIKPASASVAATSTGTGTGTNTSKNTNTSSPNHTTSKSALSTGAKAGIGVGVACGVILALSVLFWFLYRRRLHNNQPADANQESSSAPTSAGPVPELPATRTWRHPPSELPAGGGGGQAQELDSVAIHEAGYGANKPEGEEMNREKTVYK
jgi:1,3-beta-glucanosyltransferase GAS1